MSKKTKTVKELNIEFQGLAERVRNLEIKIDDENGTEPTEKFEDILRSYDDKIVHLTMLLEQAKPQKENNFKCRDCEN